MGTNCVDNAHPADWIREMNKMEHDCDNRFELTGYPYTTQVGGNHYAKYAIQPTEYIIKNKLNFCEGNVIKYVSRWRDKGGVEDLKKAKHYIDMLIETEGL